MNRIVIIGVPRSGKTTLSKQMGQQSGHPTRHTDDLIGKFDWSGASLHASEWFGQPGPWIIEGVAAVRALRKWLLLNEDRKPCDRVLWLGSPRLELTPGQSGMAKGCATVWREILPQLRRRGVAVEER